MRARRSRGLDALSARPWSHLAYLVRRARRSIQGTAGRTLEKRLRPRLAPGLWDALAELRLEREIAVKHRRALRGLRSDELPSPLRLNFGSGHNAKPGWLNVDLEREAVHLDLRRPLPFLDESVVQIYSEHFFEHLTFPLEARAHLAECFRVLAPGGTIALAVPDAETVLRAYLERDDEHFRRAAELWHPEWCRSPLDHVNYHFRQDGEHKWAWDEESLVRELAEAGFVAAGRRKFDPELDSERRRGSLMVGGRKPER